MINYILGDLVADGHCKIFCHQTNCFGVMGAGIAKQIAAKYPEVKDTDRRLYRMLGSDELFGTIRAVKCNDGRTCINMYAQYGYGGSNTCRTDYAALQRCLDSLATFLNENVAEDVAVGFPYGVGCGLAGGDWARVAGMLERFAERVKQPVYVVRYTKRN